MTLDLSLLLGSAAESWEVMQCNQEALCEGCAIAFQSQERYFYLFPARSWVQQNVLWEDTRREKPHPEGRMRREKDTSPNSLFWLLVFVVGFGLVVWRGFFFPLFSFFDGNGSDFLTSQFITRLGISWLPRSRESRVFHTGSWHGCCALWLWGSALQLGQPGLEPDIPGSEDLPLWKPEGPAAHAEAMVHFQRRLSGRVTKQQARPSAAGAGEKVPWVLTCTYQLLWDLPQEISQRRHHGQGRSGWRNTGFEDGGGVSFGWTEFQTLLPMKRRGKVNAN